MGRWVVGRQACGRGIRPDTASLRLLALYGTAHLASQATNPPLPWAGLGRAGLGRAGRLHDPMTSLLPLPLLPLVPPVPPLLPHQCQWPLGPAPSCACAPPKDPKTRLL